MDSITENPDVVYLDEMYVSKPYTFLYDLDLDQDVVNRLSLQLDGVVSGNNEVYVTPLCKRLKPEIILERWDKLFQSNTSDINDTLMDLEKLNRSKFGPRSIAIPWRERKSSVDSYFKGRGRIDQLKSFTPTFKISGSLRPLTLESSIKLLKNNTNSGLPFFTRKSKVKGKLLQDFSKLLKRQDPCILFTRTQEGNKTRNVWGFPVADTCNEMRFYSPLLNYQKELPWRAALKGPTDVDRHVTRMLDACRSRNMSIVSIDFSSFDSSVSDVLIGDAFDYVKRLFQARYHDEIDYIRSRFNSINIITPDGVLRGTHGVPSGSTFTNEIDSICQYLASYSSGVIDVELFQIQGDDGLYVISREDYDKLLEALSKSGLVVNKEKSYIADNYCVYLQMLYHTDYRQSNGLIGGIYPVYRALNRLIYQERWSNFEDFGLTGVDYYSIRAISILENCKHHPLFQKLVLFVRELDKYSLGYSEGSISKYINMLKDGSGTGGVLINQYGDEITGISNFETVKILKSCA